LTAETAEWVAMGRPSALTDERRELIEAGLARGAPVAAVAAAAGVSERSIANWLSEGHVVRRSLTLADEPGDEPGVPGEGVDRFERALVGAVLRASATDWKAARWLLQIKWPEKYAR
jgi:transposase-like protein